LVSEYYICELARAARAARLLNPYSGVLPMTVRRPFTPNRLVTALTALALTLALLGVAPANAAEPSLGVAPTPVRVAPAGSCGTVACGVTRVCHRSQTNSSAATSTPPRRAIQSAVWVYSYPAPDQRTPRRIVSVARGTLAPGISSPIYLATLRLRI